MPGGAWIAPMILAVVPPGPKTGRTSAPIGTATQEPDGTIILNLRAEGARGAVGNAQFRVAPSDKDYPMVAKHVGPIPKGGSVVVRPFDH